MNSTPLFGTSAENPGTHDLVRYYRHVCRRTPMTAITRSAHRCSGVLDAAHEFAWVGRRARELRPAEVKAGVFLLKALQHHLLLHLALGEGVERLVPRQRAVPRLPLLHLLEVDFDLTVVYHSGELAAAWHGRDGGERLTRGRAVRG